MGPMGTQLHCAAVNDAPMQRMGARENPSVPHNHACRQPEKGPNGPQSL